MIFVPFWLNTLLTWFLPIPENTAPAFGENGALIKKIIQVQLLSVSMGSYSEGDNVLLYGSLKTQ